jgi:hypothetical protein
MSLTRDSILADPQQIIADLQLAECRAERDEALAERDKAQRRLAERTAERDEAPAREAAMAEVMQPINHPLARCAHPFQGYHFSLMAWRSPDPRSPELLDRGGRPFRAGETP